MAARLPCAGMQRPGVSSATGVRPTTGSTGWRGRWGGAACAAAAAATAAVPAAAALSRRAAVQGAPALTILHAAAPGRHA